MNNNIKALGRMKAGKMNGTESKYATHLESRKLAGEVQWYAFDAVNLRIGENCHYRPDFIVMLSDGSLECHEVKGYWTDDSKVKIKVAADKFPFRFIAVQMVKGQFKITEF